MIDIDWVENWALNLFKLCYLLYKLLQVANTGMHFKYLSFSHSEKNAYVKMKNALYSHFIQQL